MAQRFAGRGFLPKRPQRTIWRRHSITQTDRLSSDACVMRHTRGCPAGPCPTLSVRVFPMPMPKRIPIATASHPNVGGAPYGRPFFAPVVPVADDRRPPAFHRQVLRIHVRGTIDLFVSDGIRGHKRLDAYKYLPSNVLPLARLFLVCAQCDLVMVIARPARSVPAR